MNHIRIQNQSGEDIAGIDWYDDFDRVSLSGRTSELGELRIVRGYFRIRSCYVLTEPSLVGGIKPK